MNKNKGYSIVEILIVLILIGVMCMIIFGVSRGMKDRWNIKNDAREITASYYLVRQRACTENNPVWMKFEKNGYRYLKWYYKEKLWKAFTGAGFHPSELKSTTKLTNDVEFVMNSQGMILNAPPDLNTDPGLLSITGTKTVQLTSQGNKGIDVVNILIYPYGGIKINTDFKN